MMNATLERLESDTVSVLVASPKQHSVSDEVIQEALSEVVQPLWELT